MPAERVLGIDESPTKEARIKSWLWTFVASRSTVFALRTTRAATVLQQLLTDDSDGVVNCDRAKLYWKIGRPQWCWAHLKRDFQALIDHPDHQVKRLGHDLMRPTKELFRHWSRCRDGTITRTGLLRLLRPIRREIDNLLLRGVFSGHAKLQGLCNPLYKHRDWLWTFLDVDGVEPTNNASERAVRPAVIWRKLLFGTQSAHGSRLVETILTIVETCHRQSGNSFGYQRQTWRSLGWQIGSDKEGTACRKMPFAGDTSRGSRICSGCIVRSSMRGGCMTHPTCRRI